MIHLAFTADLRYDIAEQPADFVFGILATRTRRETVVPERHQRPGSLASA